MKPGDRVNRIDGREIVGATVIEIDGENALIEYDEGGQGWWPLDALEPQDEQN